MRGSSPSSRLAPTPCGGRNAPRRVPAGRDVQGRPGKSGHRVSAPVQKALMSVCPAALHLRGGLRPRLPARHTWEWALPSWGAGRGAVSPSGRRISRRGGSPTFPKPWPLWAGLGDAWAGGGRAPHGTGFQGWRVTLPVSPSVPIPGPAKPTSPTAAPPHPTPRARPLCRVPHPLLLGSPRAWPLWLWAARTFSPSLGRGLLGSLWEALLPLLSRVSSSPAWQSHLRSWSGRAKLPVTPTALNEGFLTPRPLPIQTQCQSLSSPIPPTPRAG